MSKSAEINVETDSRYLDLAKEPEKNKVALQEMVGEAAKKAGYPVEAYHGTGRADRVGYVFREDRATSGPMAFFTDSEEIASNYAHDKKDTSLEYEGQDEFDLFKVKSNDAEVSLRDAWKKLTYSERAAIAEKAKRVTFDDDYEQILYRADNKNGLGDLQSKLREERGGSAGDRIGDRRQDRRQDRCRHGSQPE